MLSYKVHLSSLSRLLCPAMCSLSRAYLRASNFISVVKSKVFLNNDKFKIQVRLYLCLMLVNHKLTNDKKWYRNKNYNAINLRHYWWRLIDREPRPSLPDGICCWNGRYVSWLYVPGCKYAIFSSSFQLLKKFVENFFSIYQNFKKKTKISWQLCVCWLVIRYSLGCSRDCLRLKMEIVLIDGERGDSGGALFLQSSPITYNIY